MSFRAIISFDGNCREAVTFYAKLFGQDTPRFLTYDEGGASLGPDRQVSNIMKSRVLSTSLHIADAVVEFCDSPDAFGFIRGNHMFLTVTYENPDEAEIVFDLLSDQGYVDVPFSRTQGGNYYGSVEDRFHTCWIIKSKA